MCQPEHGLADESFGLLHKGLVKNVWWVHNLGDDRFI